MKKLLFITLIIASASYGKTEVRILEDNSVITREGDVVKVTLQQTFSDVPSVPCITEFTEKRDRVENPTWKDKVKYFFYDIYDGFTWKRAAYGLGGALVAGGAYRFGKRARREHYGHRAFENVKGWFHKK